MKNILFLLILTLAILQSCNHNIISGDENTNKPGSTEIPKLEGTKWKLKGIVDEQTGKLQILEPTKCKLCYTLIFDTDTTGTGTGYSSSNTFDISLKDSPYTWRTTEVIEGSDEKLFHDAFKLADNIEYDSVNIKLKFSYKMDDKNGHLLFEKVENDIDMPNIDFSNIDNLYEQPLSVIQKAIQGKWQYTKCCGGVVGCIDITDRLVTYTTNKSIMMNTTTEEETVTTYSWKRKKATVLDEGVLKNIETYMMWPDDAKASDVGLVAMYLINDSLTIYNCERVIDNYFDFGTFILHYTRIKE